MKRPYDYTFKISSFRIFESFQKKLKNRIAFQTDSKFDKYA